MVLWNEFLRGALPYQDYWLPLLIGMVAGSLCLLVGTRFWRGQAPLAPQKTVIAATAPVHDPFEQGSLTEKRRSLRRSGNPVEALYALPDRKHLARHALVLDRSLGGLRLGAEQQFEPGTLLVVLPASATDQLPWIEVEVRTCNFVEDYWELGCQFIKTPPWSVLLLFG